MGVLRLAMEMTQGAEFERRFRAYEQVINHVPTNPLDVDVYDAAFVVRRRQATHAPEITRATTMDGRITRHGTDGFLLEISAGVTLDFPDGDFFYWLTVWPTGDNDQTDVWLRGPLKILPGIEVM